MYSTSCRILRHPGMSTVPDLDSEPFILTLIITETKEAYAPSSNPRVSDCGGLAQNPSEQSRIIAESTELMNQTRLRDTH